jgi:hypothetical protein
MSDLKQQLYQELATKNEAMVEGIAFNPNIFKPLDLGGKYQEQVHTLFEMDHEHHVNIAFPCGFRTPNGLHIGLRWDNRSIYSISLDGGVYHLRRGGEALFPVEFDLRPQYYQYQTSDGVQMKTVAAYGREGVLNVAYSNECALKDKGEDCLFCNANATKDAYGEKESIFWKNPRQIGETVAKAYQLGARHVNLTGGFIPERREVDYYLDVAEAIQEATGLEDFNGTAVIGAPKDLKVIDKYKEAGFRTLAINIECFDRNYFNTICPGKVSHCGSYEHWLEAIGYAASVFGFGRVRSGIVAGIEPKEKTLEGVEYFASLGVITLTGAWCANPGSALEGHRTPTPEWHLDMAKKSAAIARKAGFTYEQLYDTAPSPTFLVHDIYQIEDETLPVFKKDAA